MKRINYFIIAISITSIVSIAMCIIVHKQNNGISNLIRLNIEALTQSESTTKNWIPIETYCSKCCNYRVPSCLWDPEGNGHECIPGYCKVCGGVKGIYKTSI